MEDVLGNGNDQGAPESGDSSGRQIDEGGEDWGYPEPNLDGLGGGYGGHDVGARDESTGSGLRVDAEVVEGELLEVLPEGAEVGKKAEVRGVDGEDDGVGAEVRG